MGVARARPHVLTHRAVSYVRVILDTPVREQLVQTSTNVPPTTVAALPLVVRARTQRGPVSAVVTTDTKAAVLSVQPVVLRIVSFTLQTPVNAMLVP